MGTKKLQRAGSGKLSHDLLGAALAAVMTAGGAPSLARSQGLPIYQRMVPVPIADALNRC